MQARNVSEQQGGIARRLARWVALGALFIVPLAPLIVADSYFFPFITGKAFFFRAVIEFAVVAWVVLAFLDKEYRPRFSWVGVAACAFVAWMFIADLFALNVAKAFWSNFERMEGWVLLIHLLGFFFAASAVLRAEKKWRAWFFASLSVSIIICAYALLQLSGAFAIHQGSTRIDASLGNSAYLAIYFLFNVFIALWLASTEQRAWLKRSLVALAALESILILFTETRGTILGLIGALALAALLIALTAGARVRRRALGALAAIVILVGGFYAIRNSSFVRGNSTLERIASISLSDGATRFTIWHMAFQGVLERPIIGWGQEGFNYVFNKYYDPSLFQQEQWFDRAHNAFIDWLAAGGVPAFLLYLSLFGTALFLLWRSPGFSRGERIALIAALVGYACHNLFVFDNLYSYVYFFALLALIDARVARPLAWFERMPVLSTEGGTIYALPIAAVVSIALVWSVNIPGMNAASELITALSPSQNGVDANIATFEDLAMHPSFAAQEIREQLVSFATSVAQNSSATDAEKQRIVSLALTEMQKQVTAYPQDAREHLQLAYVYRVAGDSASTLKEIQTAITLSPKKEEFWIEAGATEWDAGNVQAAQTDFNTAYALGPQFPELAAYAAAGDISVGDRTTARQLLMNTYGTTTVDNDVLAIAYYRAKDWPDLINLWTLRTGKSNASAQTWFSLAAAYYTAGETARAIQTIHTAVALFPDAASSGAAALKQIESAPSGQ